MSELKDLLDAAESPRDRIKRLRADRKERRDLATMLSEAGIDDQIESPSSKKEGELSAEDQATLDSVFGGPRTKEGEKTEGPGFIGGVARGLREEFAPFSYSEEEIEKRKAEDVSGMGIAGEVVGGITGSVAATAAAAKVGSVVGSFLAGPAAPLGAIIGAGVGAVGYALYTGFGQEKLQSAVANQETSAARAVARSMLAINPAARITGRAASVLGRTAPKLVKVAESKAGLISRGAAQVTGEAAVAGSTYGEEAGLAAGAASLIMSPLVFGRAKGAPTPSEVKSFNDFMESETGLAIIDRRAGELKEVSNMKVSRENLREDGFLTYLLGQPNMPGSGGRVYQMTVEQRKEAFKEMVVRMDKKGRLVGGLRHEALPEIYRGYKAQKVLLDGVKEANKEQGKLLSQAASRGDKFPDVDAFSDPFRWLADGQYIARAIDRVAGTNYTTQLNKAAEVGNKFEVAKAGLQRLALNAQKEEKKLIKALDGRLGSTHEEVTQNIGRLRIFISENDARFLTPELEGLVDIKKRTIKMDTEAGQMVQNTLQKWDDFFETARTMSNNSEYFIPKVEGYATRKALGVVDLVTSMRRSMQEFKGIASSVGVSDVFKMKVDDLLDAGFDEELATQIIDEVDSLGYIARTRLGIIKEQLNEAKLGKVFKDLISSGDARLGLGTELGAAMQRGEANIAPRFRQLNMTDLAMTYIDNTVRNSMFSKVYRELSDSMHVIKAAGMEQAAHWMQSHLDDMIGGTKAGKMKISNMLQSSVDRYKVETVRLFEDTKYQDGLLQKAALYIPDLISKSRSMIYPSYLAGNVKAHLRDYGQVLLKAAPELGGWYGYKTAFKSYRSVLNLGRDESGKFSFGLLKKNLQDAGVVGEYNITAEAVRAEKPSAGAISGLYNQISEASMTVYGMGDFVNRAVTYAMGKELAKDLAAGDQAALKALGNLGSAARSNLKAAGFREAIQEGDIEKAGDILGRWLVPKTQFYYGSVQKSQFARFLGPTFSMFTKWPTSIGSEIVDIWKENPGLYRKFKRYTDIHMAPLMILSSVDYTMNTYFDGDEEGAYKYLIGSAREMAPVYSLEFTAFKNPTVDLADYALSSIKEAASDPSLEGAQRQAAKVVKKAAKQTLGPISAIMNEIERFEERAQGKKKTSVDEMFNDIFGVD
jgi:hypothetical protein